MKDELVIEYIHLMNILERKDKESLFLYYSTFHASLQM